MSTLGAGSINPDGKLQFRMGTEKYTFKFAVKTGVAVLVCPTPNAARPDIGLRPSKAFSEVGRPCAEGLSASGGLHPPHSSHTLDSFASMLSLPKVDVIKIDTEGAELLVLEVYHLL